MKETVLITGASSGIGWEFAKIFAAQGYDLILTARREDRLKELKEQCENEYHARVEVITCDLSRPGAAQLIFDHTQSKNLQVDVLVNNAGFGLFGAFIDANLQRMTEMVQVNVTALMELTHLFLNDMIKRNQGSILNVASMAAFVPGPYHSIYFASKAFVLSFSEALADELKGSKVTVTVLCPGPFKSEFQAVAYNEDSSITMKRRIPTSVEKARFGYEAMLRGKLISIYGLFNTLVPWALRILPRSLVVRLVRAKQEIHLKSLN